MLNELRSQTKGLRVWRIRGRGFEKHRLKKGVFLFIQCSIKNRRGMWKICVYSILINIKKNCKTSKKGIPEESNMWKISFLSLSHFLWKVYASMNDGWFNNMQNEYWFKEIHSKEMLFSCFFDLSRIWVENDKIIPTSEDWKVDVLIFPSVFFKNFEIYKW